MNTSDLNWDALLRAAARDLLKEEDDYLRTADTSKVEISKRANRRIEKKIKNYERESWWNSTPLVFRRIVAALMLACTVSFGLCLSVSALRAEMVKLIMEWHEEFVSVIYVADHEPPSVIEEYREPVLQLVGTERQVALKTNIVYHIVYFKENELIMSYQQMKLTDRPIDIDNERCTIEDIEINGNKGQLFVYEDNRYAFTWSDTEYKYLICTLTPDIERDVLFAIVDSIY